MHKLNKFKLPDDVDTTSMVQMASDISKEDAILTKDQLPRHANQFSLTIKNGHKQLRGLKAYSTWFGEKMPIEFDICVLSNLLIWIDKFDFKFNNNDEATLQLIVESINDSLYFQSAFKSSPEYPKIEIILYHLARLASQTNYLQNLYEKLTDDIYKVLLKTNNPFGKMLLETSLMRLGVDTSKNHTYEIHIAHQNYWWFSAGFLSVFSNQIIQKIAPFELFHYRYFCPALNLTLLFENVVLAKTQIV